MVPDPSSPEIQGSSQWCSLALAILSDEVELQTPTLPLTLFTLQFLIQRLHFSSKKL